MAGASEVREPDVPGTGTGSAIIMLTDIRWSTYTAFLLDTVLPSPPPPPPFLSTGPFRPPVHPQRRELVNFHGA